MAENETLSMRHPQYTNILEDYVVMTDTFSGEREVKDKGIAYLPATSGQIALKMDNTTDAGFKLYTAYKKRAVFPELVRETANALVGVMTRENWTVELPSRLEPMREKCTPRGEHINTLIRRILLAQLTHGRRGLLLDVDASRNLPYIADYHAMRIINWDDVPEVGEAEHKMAMILLDETTETRKPGQFQWVTEKRHRILSLGDFYNIQKNDGKYSVTTEVDGDRGEVIVPSIQGKTLDRIPFVFINSTDLAPEPGEIPLLGLARLALSIYRAEADYRLSLFMTSQDTLVVTGVNISPENEDTTDGSDIIIGAGAMINIPDPDGDAKFIGVNGVGLQEQREALQNDYNRGVQYGVGVLSGGRQGEAQETVKIRVAARTATAKTIVETCREGLENILKMSAEWVGANPDEVEVSANTDFAENDMTPRELVEMVTAKVSGAPMSWRTVHANMKKRGLTDLNYEDELEEIESEIDTLGNDLSGEPDEREVEDENIDDENNPDDDDNNEND